ncbi:MAG: hypothetical protein KBG25_02765 [Paludibacteraceae bacterium]|nr:hypothetical protein [Paludibacteraceae bacterium]
MAQQVGVIKYKGTIGDIRHFKIKGLHGDYAGLKGGPSAEQIKTDPVFQRTRENMNEFSGCAAAAKSLRMGLSPLMAQMSDPHLTGRLTAIMKKINLEDQSEARGYRAVLISDQRKYLKGLNFNKNISLESVLLAPFTVSNTEDRTIAILTVPTFNPATGIKAPAGATHFRFVNALSVISDFAYNDVTKVYEPVEPNLNEISNITYSDFIGLYGGEVEEIEVISSLPEETVLTDNVSVIQSIGIEFYQKVGENYYLFNSGNCLKIGELF